MQERAATESVVHRMKSQDRRILFVVLSKEDSDLLRDQVVERIPVSQKENHYSCGPFVS